MDTSKIDEAALEQMSEAEKRELYKLLERRERLRNQQRAQTDFLTFAEHVWPQFVHGQHHQIVADAFERILQGKLKRLVISLPPRHALAVDTPIPTPDGFKRMDELREGDYVFGPDGKPTQVIGCSEVFKDRPVWRVSTNDGASVLADEDHLWNVRLDRKHPVYKNKTTGYLWERQQTGARPAILPKNHCIQTPEADLPIHPYVLGVWLGDGHHRNAIISEGDQDYDYIRQRVESCGFVTSDQSTKGTFGILGLRVLLREAGVFGNKHIPEQYLFASEQQRRELLYGLMDTDGNVTKDGQCLYNTSSETLKDQAVILLRSLGIKASVATCQAWFEGRDYGNSYRISFYHPEPCTLPRRLERARGYKKPVRRNISLQPEGTCDTRCIKVAREDGLFLVGQGFIVSHNTKSEMSSWLLPAWYLGHRPDAKILHASHTQDLTANFGRKIRDLIEDPDYKEIFPDTILKTDAKSAGKWQTASGGQYFAAGVGGALAGRGADLCIIDDPISEQDTTEGAFEQCWEWFQSGPRQRLQPGGIIVIIMTRWSKKDLVGRLLRKMEKDPLAERYEYIEFPAVIYEEGHENDDDHALDSLWPEYWPLEDMLAVKRTISPHLWNAQYMQRPTGKGSTLVTKDMIKQWPAEKPLPELEFLLHSYDPAFEEKESRDPTGFNKWAAFRPVGEFGGKKYDGTQLCFILLGSMKKRMDFPALKRMVIGQYRSDKPDTVVIEKRASGFPLIQELWRAGLFLESFTPHRGTGDKYARLNSVVSMFEEGLVFVLEGPQWAEEFVEDITSFPNAEEDDLVDAAVMALLRFKRGNLVRFQDDDEADEDKLPVRRRLYNI